MTAEAEAFTAFWLTAKSYIVVLAVIAGFRPSGSSPLNPTSRLATGFYRRIHAAVFPATPSRAAGVSRSGNCEGHWWKPDHVGSEPYRYRSPTINWLLLNILLPFVPLLFSIFLLLASPVSARAPAFWEQHKLHHTDERVLPLLWTAPLAKRASVCSRSPFQWSFC